MSRAPMAGLSRRFLAIGAALAVAGSVFVVPAIGAEPSSRSAGWGPPMTRAPIATSRVTGRDAARKSIANPRAGTASISRARPDRFGGAGITPIPTVSGDTARAPKVALPGALVSTREMPGIDAATVGAEPPDPWIAVSGSYLVQSTNGAVRISDRNGHLLVETATWALFSIPGGFADSDPRIIWDAAHSRWVGVLLAYDDPLSLGFLSIIVSDGADPRAGWNVYQFDYTDVDGAHLPDYPAIASSSDKLVVTANEFLADESFVGTSFLVLPWSSILAGTDPSAAYGRNPTAWNLRPGRLISAGSDVHLVFEDVDDTLWYMQMHGSPTTFTLIGNPLGIPAGTYDLPAPRQPSDPDGIALADDGRIPDVVWRANELWFARTIAGSWDGGTTTDLVVEVTRIQTASGAEATVPGGAQTYHGELGVDAFMPGVGMTGDGSLLLEYSRSSDSAPPAILAEAFKAPYDWSSPLVIEESDANYDTDRWGDYVGIAADPAGTATAWQSNEVAAADGTWRTVVSRLVLDFVPPTATAPNQALVSGSRLGSTVPVRVSWSGADAGSGVTGYALQSKELGDPDYFTFAHPTGTSLVRAEFWKPAGSSSNSSYGYTVQSFDDAGNASNVATGSTLTPTVYQQTSASFSSGWHNASSSSFSGGSVKYSSTGGASATFKTSGRSFGFVTYRSSTRGKVKIYVDGSYKGRFTLASSTVRARNLFYVASFGSSGTHTIKLVVYKGRVDVDAFVVLK